MNLANRRRYRSAYQATTLRHPVSMALAFLSVIAVGIAVGYGFAMINSNTVKTTTPKPVAKLINKPLQMPSVAIVKPKVKPKIARQVKAKQVAPVNVSHMPTISPKNFESKSQIVKRRRKLSGPQVAEFWLGQALDADDRGADKMTGLFIKKAYNFDPKNVRICEVYGEYLEQHQQYKKAISVLAPLREQRADRAQVRKLLALAYVGLDQPNLALAELDQVSPKIRDDSEYYVMKAGLYLQLNKPEQAAALYQRLVKHDPSNAKWWVGYAAALEMEGKDQLALKAYKQAKRYGDLSSEVSLYVNDKIDSLIA